MKRQTLGYLSALALCPSLVIAQEKPNIIFILADDMGYGDISALNKDSKIQTPHLDRMVSEGLSFRDAHTSSSVSTPTRYGVLTGRYNWRSVLKSGVLSGYSKPLIPTDRTTIASLLKRADYRTGCVGKWHLGWEWPFTEAPTQINELSANNKGKIDYSQPIKKGPTALGFDYFYGFSGSLDMPPYVYVENDFATVVPNRDTVNKGKYSWWRKGPTGEDFIHEETLPHLTDKAIDFMKRESKGNDPFFLYIPYPAPHTPILPLGKWEGKSGLNPYGDFVMMVDHEVGRIMKALKKMGIDENTLVVFTTDNGCSPAAKMNELHEKGHFPSYVYRGHKADLFEGGHRVPCIVQWPAGIKPGETDQTICLTDFFSTFASLAGVDVLETEGEDSYNLCEVFENPNHSSPIREATIHHSITGEFAIRSGDWKLLVAPSSGGWSAPTPSNKEVLATLPPMQLYNLRNDPQEQKNLYDQEPEKVKELIALLRKQISDGRSTAGEPQSNEVRGRWKQLERIF